MSVSRRILLSVAALMLLAFASLGYQLWVVYRMEQSLQELSSVNFTAASELLQMTQDADEVQTMSRKFLAVGMGRMRDDLRFGLNDRIARFDSRLRVLSAAWMEWDREPPQAFAALQSAWSDYRSQMEKVRAAPPSEGVDDLPAELDTPLKNLRERTETCYQAVLKDIATQAERTSEMGRQAVNVSFAAAFLFLLVGGVMVMLMVQSINAPLRQLTRGTRKITKGEFSHRLPVVGPSEFAELAHDFNAMTERLGELDRMKKDFVSHVSHELKAPLAAIRQTLAVTIGGVPGPINDQQRRLLQLSLSSAERLSAMVANILDASRLEAGTMEYAMAAQNLVQIVDAAVAEFSVKAEERGISIEVRTDYATIPLVCDRDRMIQVFGNLIENAVKFSPVNRNIVIGLEWQMPTETVVVSVADRGPGVPERHRQDVFLKFHQLNGGGKRSVGQGVGLGLAICKTIVDGHRGRIWVDDNPGGGSIFRIEMHTERVPVPEIRCAEV